MSIHVCAYCYSEIHNVRVGDESYSMCPECGIAEGYGASIYVTPESYESYINGEVDAPTEEE